MKKNILFTFLIGFLYLTATSQTRITNNANLGITPGNSVSCNSGGIINSDNSFFHVYDLDNYANIIDTAFIVRMYVGCEETSGGPYNIVGKVYTIVGAPSLLNLTLISDDTVAIFPDSTLYLINIPFTNGYVLPGDSIVSELHLPANLLASFYPASNTSLESSPTYLVATLCGITDFTTTAVVGFPLMHLLMNVYVNQRPSMTGFTASTFKDQQLNFAEPEFTSLFVDNDLDGLTMARVTAVPTNGDLDLSGTTLVVGDTIYTTELDMLKYFPNTGYFGPDSFSLLPKDSSLWANASAVYDINVINWQLSLSETENSPMNIYPNPSTGLVTIQIAEQIEQIKIYSSDAKVVFTRVSDESVIDISTLHSGTYFVEVKTNKGTYVQQLIKD